MTQDQVTLLRLMIAAQTAMIDASARTMVNFPGQPMAWVIYDGQLRGELYRLMRQLKIDTGRWE